MIYNLFMTLMICNHNECPHIHYILMNINKNWFKSFKICFKTQQIKPGGMYFFRFDKILFIASNYLKKDFFLTILNFNVRPKLCTDRFSLSGDWMSHIKYLPAMKDTEHIEISLTFHSHINCIQYEHRPHGYHWCLLSSR